MNEKEKILELAHSEVGYLEKASNEDLDDKIANAGSNNYTKYARDMDALDVYNTPKQGYPWCKVFIDWLFVQVLGVDRAGELLKGWTAGVEQFYNWFEGQTYEDAEVGDLIIFGDCDHIGIVTGVDDEKVYTIEGNTSGSTGLVANGGAVVEKSYYKTSSYIKCYARPDYKEENLRCKVHLENIGWTDWIKMGEIAGTTGQSRRLEAIILEADGTDLRYRAHVEGIGWQDWVNKGEVAGTTGQSRRLEALEIQSSVSLKVSEHLEKVGWMPDSVGKSIKVGTEGKALRLEAIKIELA